METKKIIQRLCLVVIIVIASYGIVANFLHYILIRDGEKFDFDSNSTITEIKNQITETKAIYTKINLDNLQGEEKDDYTKIKENISESLYIIENLEFLNQKGVVKLTASKYFKIFLDQNNSVSLIANSFDIIEKYEPSMKGIAKVMNQSLLTQMLSEVPYYENSIKNYNYFSKINNSVVIDNESNFKTYISLARRKAETTQLLFITNWLYRRTAGASNE